MKKFFLFLITLCALTFCVSASATDIYFANAATGADNGLNCANAHAVLSGTNGASVVGNQVAGNNLYLCGFINPTANTVLITMNASGSSGNPISIKAAPGGALIQESWVPTSGIIKTNGQSWITIDGGTPCGNGLTACNLVIQATLNGSAGGTCLGGTCTTQNNAIGINALACANCEFKNLEISHLYDHTVFTDVTVDATQVNAIYFGGANILIHDNLFHDIGWTMAMVATGGSDANQFYNNEIYRMSHGFAMGAPSGVTINSMFIYNNHLHDMANWGTNTDAYHLTGIHLFSTPTGKIQNVYIYNNLMNGISGTCCVTGWMFLESSLSGGTPWTDATGTAYIWNNIVYSNVDNTVGIVFVGDGTGHQIFNNTIIGPNAGGNGACLSFQDSALLVTIENNVIEGCTSLVNGSSNSTISTIDYNTYANASGGNPFWQFHGGNATTLAAWRTACSCDVHSQAQLGSALANLTNNGVPSAGFIGIQWGTNLGGTATGNLLSLQNDTGAGNTHTPVARPVTAACVTQGVTVACWDDGAYQFVQVMNSTPAPAPKMFASLNKNHVNLSWQPSPTLEVKYRVYRGPKSGDYLVTRSNISSTSYIDTVTSRTTPYFYTVTAYFPSPCSEECESVFAPEVKVVCCQK